MRGTRSTVVRGSFTTRDLEHAREVLGTVYGGHTPTLRGAPGSFIVESATVTTEGLLADRLRYGSIVENRFTPREDALLVGTLRRGRIEIDDRRHPRILEAGDLQVHLPGVEQRLRSHDIDSDLVCVSMATLARVAGELTELEPHRLRFHPEPPLDPARNRFWEATRHYVVDWVLERDDVAAAPLLRAEAVDALARASLWTLPNTALDVATDPHARSRGRMAPATVRRAVAFIDAHADEDIDLTAIAEATGIGARGLQNAFRRHRDQTPMQYLHQVRLAGAHHDLQQGDPTRGDTVAAIAARWGFAHPGRFSVAYARAYGHSPSDTLRR